MFLVTHAHPVPRTDQVRQALHYQRRSTAIRSCGEGMEEKAWVISNDQVRSASSTWREPRHRPREPRHVAVHDYGFSNGRDKGEERQTEDSGGYVRFLYIDLTECIRECILLVWLQDLAFTHERLLVSFR